MEYEKWAFILPPPHKIKAFTLAEVLITLVIIGVIAAITVPILMNNTNGQEYRSMLKKAISAVNQALELHYALEGVGAQDYESESDLINEVFKKRMNVIGPEIANANQPQSRMAAMDEFYYPGYDVEDQDGYACIPTANNRYQNFFITQDGVLYCLHRWAVPSYYPDLEENEAPCNADNTIPCVNGISSPNLYIDVNALKKPNKATTSASRPRDQYAAQIYNSKVVPWGDVTQSVMYDKSVSTGT